MGEGHTDESLSRRGFLRMVPVGTAAIAGASGTATAQQGGNQSGGGNQTGGNQTGTAAGGGGGGGQVTVPLVDYAFEGATESPLTIPPGTTVRFVWETSNHNINVDQKPAESDWSGVAEVKNAGFETSHTFTVTGEFHFWCDPHKSLGMIGDITVEEGATLPGQGGGGAGGGGGPTLPNSAKTLAIATAGSMASVLGLAYFFLKYGAGHGEIEG